MVDRGTGSSSRHRRRDNTNRLQLRDQPPTPDLRRRRAVRLDSQTQRGIRLASGVDEPTGDSYLLLADLSATGLHAYWWQRITKPAPLSRWTSGDAAFEAIDLVSLCAAWWTTEQRAEHETAALRRYHEGLLAGGVRGYLYDDLMTDYRRAIIDWLLTPIQDAADGAGPNYWLPRCET